MFRALFLATLLATLAINIIFLFATKDKPPDLVGATSTFASTATAAQPNASRRLFSRSNDFYEFATQSSAQTETAVAAAAQRREDTNRPSNHLPPKQDTAAASRAEVAQRTTASRLALANDVSAAAATAASRPQAEVDLAALGDKRRRKSEGAYWQRRRAAAPDGAVAGPAKRKARIRVKSSKEHVFVSVNNATVYESGGESLDGGRADDEPAGRGIHVLVLNQFDGSVMARRVFDTYTPKQDEELGLFVSMLSDNRIVIFAIKDEGTFWMRPKSAARSLLERLGSKHVRSLAWRDMWALVVRKTTLGGGGADLRSSASEGRENNLGEAVSHSAGFSEWAPAIELEVEVSLSDDGDNDAGGAAGLGGGSAGSGTATAAAAAARCRAKWKLHAKDLDELQRRAEFCARVEGYGRVCDCDDSAPPAPINFEPPPIENSQLDDVPILVVASDRPYYLYRMLRSLLAADGVARNQVTVFIDGFYDEPLAVSKLFGLRAIQHRPQVAASSGWKRKGSRQGNGGGRQNARISQHYKTSLAATFEMWPRAEFAIIFEEDLDVARDALIYFNQTSVVLRNDPTLYCSSAWNDQGYEHSVGDKTLVYRVETMPGLGWMLSKRLFKDELEFQWPSAEQPHDWDMWIRTDAIRRGRECLIPDVSRTFHFGATGTNINSFFQEQYFRKHAFADTIQLEGGGSGGPNGDAADGSISPSGSAARRRRTTKGGVAPDLNSLYATNYEHLIEGLIMNSSTLLVGAAAALRSNVSSSAKARKKQLELLCSLATDTAARRLLAGSPTLVQTAAVHQKLRPQTGGNATINSAVDDDDAADRSTNVVFIKMIDRKDFSNWLKLAKCWRIWDLDARGQHNSMWRLFLAGRRSTLVVGVPSSPYAKFKPPELEPFDL